MGGPYRFPSCDGDGYALVPVAAPSSRTDRPWIRIGRTASVMANNTGVGWPQNGLRHSYATYRLAQCQDAAKVALEMGNTPTMIFRHYRELVLPQDAAAWWSISPQRVANVVPMHSHQVAT